MSNKENVKNLFGKRTRSQIEVDEKGKDRHLKKNDKMRNNNDSSKSELQMMKKILKTKPSDNDKIARISRRSTLSNQ